MSQPVDPRAERELDAIQASRTAAFAGNAVEALRVLLAVPNDGAKNLSVTIDAQGSPKIAIRATALALAARRQRLSLFLGQWSSAPRHDSHSDTPHGWVTRYESSSPELPEESSVLRWEMDELRIAVASDHGRYVRMAAWSHDFYMLATELGSEGAKLQALVNMAVASSKIGFKETAKSLYGRALKEMASSAPDLAAIRIRYGDFLWSLDDRTEAKEQYSEALDVLLAIEAPSVFQLHDLIRVQQRYADCFYQLGDYVACRDLVFQALSTVEAARERGGYQGFRSVDASVASEVGSLLELLGTSEVTGGLRRKFVKSLLILGNSSISAAVRQLAAPTGGVVLGESLRAAGDVSEVVYVADSRPANISQVRWSRFWNRISEKDVEAVMLDPTPSVFVTTTRELADRTDGVTVVAGRGHEPKVHYWTVGDQLHDGLSPNRFLKQLFSATPGANAAADNAWSSRPDNEVLSAVTNTILPKDTLSDYLENPCDGVRIIPQGAFWRFPFSAVETDTGLLGQRYALVLSPGVCVNQNAPASNNWVGHFDLMLGGAVGELLSLKRVAKASARVLRLFRNSVELSESKWSHLFFAGHAGYVQGQQVVRLADGSLLGPSDVEPIEPGAVVVLNACWSAAVSDGLGGDPVDMALDLVAAGAHSVFGAVGPVGDRAAARLLGEVTAELSNGLSLSESVRVALCRMPLRQMALSEWACYATVGRSWDWLPEEGGV